MPDDAANIDEKDDAVAMQYGKAKKGFVEHAATQDDKANTDM